MKKSQEIVRRVEGLFAPPCVAVALLAVVGVACGAEPDRRVNLADKSELPFGSGLATAYPADAGLKGNAEVIFADDFESGSLGERWDETGNKNGKVLELVSPGTDVRFGKRCLRVEAHLDKDTGGGLTKWFEPADTVFIRFYPLDEESGKRRVL